MGVVGVSSPAGIGSVPPYAAAVAVVGGSWRSALGREGRIMLARPAVQIGRMEGNDLILSDPLVSRYHCVIRWTPSGYELEDLASANGTFVQGRRVTGRMLLAPGAVIRAGNVDLVFDVLQPAAIPAAGTFQGISQPESRQALGSLPYFGALAPSRSGILGALRSEASKRYWRVFAVGLAAYFVVSSVLSATGNLHLVPLVLLLASALVPSVFVIFCWEQNAFADMPVSVVALTFLSGAVLGLTLAAVLEPLFIPADASGTVTLGAALVIGLVEESAKVVSVLWWLRDRRVRSELDGLILGAAAGMGFAALETAGYGFVAFLTGFGSALNMPGSTEAFVLGVGIRQMNRQLIVRMALAIFGHGVWTGIVCAAIWRERRGAFVRPTGAVIGAFALAVGLHALWDWEPLTLLNISGDPFIAVVLEFVWFLALGTIGMYVLRLFLRDAVRRAKLGPHAPPPAGLLRGPFEGARAHGTGRPSGSNGV